MIRSAVDLLRAVSGYAQPAAPRAQRLATVDPAYSTASYPGTLPKVTFDGEATLSVKRYTVAGNYLPRAGDRVLMVSAGQTYTIVGAIPATADRASGAWQDFTPVWTAVTTDPVLGSGTIVGRWCRVGNLVTYAGRIVMAADTTYGSGDWRVSTPVPQPGSLIAAGSAMIHNAATLANRAPGTVFHNSASLLAFYANGGQISSAVPFAWASGDQLRWTITYEVA